MSPDLLALLQERIRGMINDRLLCLTDKAFFECAASDIPEHGIANRPLVATTLVDNIIEEFRSISLWQTASLLPDTLDGVEVMLQDFIALIARLQQRN